MDLARTQDAHRDKAPSAFRRKTDLVPRQRARLNIRLIDALALASWQRSGTKTHRFSDTARSLTVCDAHNVQSLARHLIMEKFGFCRRG